MVPTKDGSNTLFSSFYKQHYHNIDDGALKEALYKHIIPALTFHKGASFLTILDICFGLGYNTFATIYYIKKQNLPIRVRFFSPELDKELVNSLKDFIYPKEFETIKPIIDSLLLNHYYKDEQFEIELFFGNAREYIKNLSTVDVVYQDAFSSEVNFELWTKQYFSDIYALCTPKAVVTSYAVATSIRLSMFEAGFTIYEHIPKKRKITLGFKSRQNILGKYVDMELKKQRNSKAKALYDSK